VGWSHNLSRGGACLELAERIQTEIPLRLRFQTERGAIDAEGRVVWTGDPGSSGNGILHGVVFSEITPDHLQALRALLYSKGALRQAGLRLPLQLPVTCRLKDPGISPVEGRTGNLSRGGILLCLPQAFPPETAVELTLHTPHGPLTAEGVVVWMDSPERPTESEPIRHGLKFTALGWSTTLSLGLILADPL
jgi:hypothetical protein